MQCVSIFQKTHETLGQTSKQCRKEGAEGGKKIEVTEVGADELGKRQPQIAGGERDVVSGSSANIDNHEERIKKVSVNNFYGNKNASMIN